MELYVGRCMYIHVYIYIRIFMYMQGGIEAEREERERRINKDVNKMMDSVEGNNQ